MATANETPKMAPTGYRPLWCRSHAHSTKSIYAERIRCNIKTCKKTPNYGYLNDTIAKYCVTHKKEKMIDITNKTCIHEGCNKKSIIGGTDNIPKYCRSHNVIVKGIETQRCAFHTCKRIPIKKYNYIFCKYHFVKGNPDQCLMCTNIITTGIYCNTCESIIDSNNVDAIANEFNLINERNESLDALVKPEIDFSIKLDYVSVDFLLKELDDFHSTHPYNQHDPYDMNDYIDVPDLF